jgi:hypothetical protein
MSSPWIIPCSSKPALQQAIPEALPESNGTSWRGPGWQMPKTKQTDNSMHPGLRPRSPDGGPIPPPDQPGSCRCPEPQGVHALENPGCDRPTVALAFPGPGPHQQEPLPAIPYIWIVCKHELLVHAQVDTRPESGHSHGNPGLGQSTGRGVCRQGPMGKRIRREQVCTPATHLATGTPLPLHRRGPDWEASLQMLTGQPRSARKTPNKCNPEQKRCGNSPLHHSHQSPVHRCGSTYLAEWATW